MSTTVNIRVTTGPCEGTSIFGASVGAIVKFDRNSQSWSNRLYYGPVKLLRSPDNTNMLNIQVYNRLNIDGFCVEVSENTEFHRDGTTLMFRTALQEIYGLVCKEHEMNALQRDMASFFMTSKKKPAVPILACSLHDRVRSLTSPQKRNDPKPLKQSPRHSFLIKSSAEKENKTSTGMPTASPRRSHHIAHGSQPQMGSPLPAPRAPPLSWNGNPSFVPLSVFRRAAARKIVNPDRDRGPLSNG